MRPFPLLAAACALAAAGCSRNPPPAAVAEHRAVAPHGGTPVALGDGHYRVELVLDAAQGRLQAYVLDDDLENFIPSSSATIPLAVAAGGAHADLVLAATANALTGETVGATSLFEVQSDWLRAHPAFDGTLGPLTIRGSVLAPARFHVGAAAPRG
jgi:hypothetical protein